MLNEVESAEVSNGDEEAQMISVSEEPPITAGDEVIQALREGVRLLPPQAVKDLLSIGVCVQCIFRLFGVHGHNYSCFSILQSNLYAVLGELIYLDKQILDNTSPKEYSIRHSSKDSEIEPPICSICLGILQFFYYDDKEQPVRKNCPHDLAASISEVVKTEGHQIDNFSFEVSIPPIIVENEQAVRFYMESKYGSEPWFHNTFRPECISVKDALKLYVVTPLAMSLDIQSSPSSFHVRLTYSHAKASSRTNFSEGIQDSKRRKAGEKMCSDTKKSLHGLLEDESSECCKLPLEKVSQPCSLSITCYRKPIYIGGRYLKYSRNVSQTRWIIDDERMGEASVEEIIGGTIRPMCQGDNYKFHAAGREDIDVRMLGSGRPFLVEVQNARIVPSEVAINDIEEKINNCKKVRVKSLKVVGTHGWALMREGEMEKQKQYAAIVWISRPLEDEDLQNICALKEMKISQKTPIRVLHRRSPLEREKIIHWMKIERLAESSQYFLLHLCTQAGTYIKEFVHGDLGRTYPNIGSILGCMAEILQLDVTDVKMDGFNTD